MQRHALQRGHADELRVAQVERLQENRGLSGEIAQKIIATQLDLGLKINKADHLIWNESNLRTLEGQTALLVGWLKERYG